MQRRRFLELAAIGVVDWVLHQSVHARPRNGETVHCRVAGVRYQDIDVFRLRSGQRVTVKRDRYQDEACYKVTTLDGAMLGYVPRALVPLLEARGVLSAWLSKANPHALPWKQVEIVILLE